MKKLILLLLLLTSCVAVKNPEKSGIFVIINNTIAQDKSIHYGQEITINFHFDSNDSEGLYPKVYIYGPVTPILLPEGVKLIDIKQDTAYRAIIKFKRPADAVILFIWEGKGGFGASKTIYLIWKDNE